MKIKLKITTSENVSHYGVSSGSIVEEDFEKYVSAVVASEIGNATLEACKAQAVASRTFAYRYVLKNKPIPDSSSSAQAYRSNRYSSAYKRCIDAANATKGQILIYQNEPIDSYFCNSNGGKTVSSKEKWGGERDYLISKQDPWDKASCAKKNGHGVGMSQAGAKYAAEHGVSYKDILLFYYPGTSLSKIEEKEETVPMVSLSKFMDGCKRNAERIHGYKLRCTGSNGFSDCIGYVIGSLELAGQKWNGTHGSNYAARYRTKNLHKVTNASQLKLGELVYKAYLPGTASWQKSFPKTYKNSPDQNDYYHVGVVTSINPLTISHCSGGGMHYDKTLGKWGYAGYCSLVDYGSKDSTTPTISEPVDSRPAVGQMVVDVPNDTSVNVRNKPSLTANVLTRLPEGSKVEVTSVSGEWNHVNYTYQKTGTGYVMSKFIKSNVVDVPDDTSVNVRRSPSTSASKITTLPEGTKVVITSTSGAWSKVDYAYSHSGTGYVMSKYLKKG